MQEGKYDLFCCHLVQSYGYMIRGCQEGGFQVPGVSGYNAHCSPIAESPPLKAES